jgi:hypothetical protein
MMKRIVIGLVAVLLTGLGVQASEAQSPLFPNRAPRFSTWLVRAFDACTPAGLTVTAPANLPTGGCFASLSDPFPPPLGSNPLGATMKLGKLDVSRFPGLAGGQGRVKLFMTGLQNGQKVKVRLSVRTTRAGVTTKHPSKTSALVTFADTIFECGNQLSNCFVANARGVVLGTESLQDCLTQSSQPKGLASHNLEILSAEVVNCDDGNVVARAGILN